MPTIIEDKELILEEFTNNTVVSKEVEKEIKKFKRSHQERRLQAQH